MIVEETYKTSKVSLRDKVKDYAAFAKLRLASLVVVSAVTGFYMADKTNVSALLYLIVGGFLVTGASNGLNQIIEKEHDKKMTRTQNRPLPKGTMSVTEAIILASIMGVVGLICLAQLNVLSAVLGFLALFLYAAIYTPMKRISPWAVFVGAIPGAIPPMLGYVAVTGEFGLEPGILFLVQFMWQFPHFWAIAWVCDEDYQKGGYRLLPTAEGKGKKTALIIMIYTLMTVPMSMMPWMFNMSGLLSVIVCVIAGQLFFNQSLKLLKTCDDKDARKLMFYSFFYLPIVQIIYVIDKL